MVIIEKREECPRCGEVQRWVYDAQICAACGFGNLSSVDAAPNPDACEHDFQAWREFPDGDGRERVCESCGMGAMEHMLKHGL